jgi:hypothetical protein
MFGLSQTWGSSAPFPRWRVAQPQGSFTGRLACISQISCSSISGTDGDYCPVAALRLGLIEGDIGGVKQLLGCRTVFGECGDDGGERHGLRRATAEGRRVARVRGCPMFGLSQTWGSSVPFSWSHQVM